MPILTRREPHPRFSQYQRYKACLREDLQYRCVYCGIHEAEWGGHRHFQVEHLRPKKLFPWLQAEYSNLLYACDVCNAYKGCDWPNNDPTPHTRGYLDPCQYDYDQYFVLLEDGSIMGKTLAARYMVESLHLNRKQLRDLRMKRQEEQEIHQQFMQFCAEMEARAATIEEKSARERILRKAILQLIALYRQHLQALWERRWQPPYGLDDLASE